MKALEGEGAANPEVNLSGIPVVRRPGRKRLSANTAGEAQQGFISSQGRARLGSSVAGTQPWATDKRKIHSKSVQLSVPLPLPHAASKHGEEHLCGRTPLVAVALMFGGLTCVVENRDHAFSQSNLSPKPSIRQTDSAGP